jgi:hypothetical protein
LILLAAGLLAGNLLHLGTGTQIAAVAVLVAISGEIGLLVWQARQMLVVNVQPSTVAGH